VRRQLSWIMEGRTLGEGAAPRLLSVAHVKRFALVGLLVCLCAGGVAWLRPDDRPGVLAPDEPLQQMLGADAPSFSREGWQIHALATYDITARVLHKKRYYVGPTADLVPYDFAVGWGPMSDSAVLRHLTISQGNRFFFWEYQEPPPIPQDQIICHAANMHLIPSSGAVRRALWWASAGDVVRLTGYLVEASYPGWNLWRSSLSRTDTGNGSCELMWVESCEVLPPGAGAAPQQGSGSQKTAATNSQTVIFF